MNQRGLSTGKKNLKLRTDGELLNMLTEFDFKTTAALAIAALPLHFFVPKWNRDVFDSTYEACAALCMPFHAMEGIRYGALNNRPHCGVVHNKNKIGT